MFEIFLFINPIGIYCYDVESRIEQAATELGIDACYHYVPIADVEIGHKDVVRRHRKNQRVGNFSYYTVTSNRALRAYHAIKIAYGNKKARKFLFKMQQALNNGTENCPFSLPEKVITSLHLNIKKVDSLLHSDYVLDSIKEDQKLIDQWQIKQTPTTIIFNENNESDSGILLEGIVDQDNLANIFTSSTDSQDKFEPIFSANHLRLI